jgi:hypothetical protein
MIVYYIDGKKFIADKPNEIPVDEISSPDENTPAYENLETGFKFWCLKGQIFHRLTGPASINDADNSDAFWLNGTYYHNINSWFKAHPNQANAFQIEMLLKYT